MLSEVALMDKLQRNKLQSVWGARCHANKADIGSSGRLSKMTGAREESLIIYKQKSAITDISLHWLDRTSGCLTSNTRSWFMFNLKSRSDRKCVEIRLQHQLLPGFLHSLWLENDEQVLSADRYKREYCKKIAIHTLKFDRENQFAVFSSLRSEFFLTGTSPACSSVLLATTDWHGKIY